MNNLVNYYLKSETYSSAQVDALIATVKQFQYTAVSTLPTASADTMGIIYLVPGSSPKQQNVKDEYITLSMNEGGETTYYWEMIGQTTISWTTISVTLWGRGIRCLMACTKMKN